MTLEMTCPSVDASPLRGLCGGNVHLPGDPGYDAARMPWAVAVDQRPAAVAVPRSVTDVSEVVRAAADLGLRVAPQSTGHNAGPLAAQGLADVVVVRLSELDEVSVDTERGVVRVGGGALWLAAVEAAAEAGGTVLHGSSPDVGIAGYTLGGGIGWYARKLGMAAHHLTAVELVDARGALVRADTETNAPLLWALRGGGGSFGVVTALEFRLLDLATAYAGMLVWDIAHAERVLRAWSTWAPGAPDEVTTSFRLLRVPPLPDIPELFRGRSLVVVDGAVLDTDERAAEILSALRALEPELDTFGRTPTRELVRLHMDPEGPTPAVSATTMLGSFPEQAVQAFLSHAGPDSATSLLAAEIRQLGGALGRPVDGAALSHFEGEFLVFGVAVAATPEMGARGHADAVALTSSLAEFATGGCYLNYVEEPTDVRRGFPEASWQRLADLRATLDPGGLFRANHVVPG